MSSTVGGSGWDCDALEWLVDILGTMELLATVGDCGVYDVSGRGPQRSAFRGGQGADGLYFDGAHWYSMKGGTVTDSYKLDYQIKGTAHFCQTFALMIHLGETSGLQAGDYDKNIEQAISFWINFFKSQKRICTWVCTNIKRSKWKDVVPTGEINTLETITPTMLLRFLVGVYNNAGIFVNCKQG